jgi:hypothetical protein
MRWRVRISGMGAGMRGQVSSVSPKSLYAWRFESSYSSARRSMLMPVWCPGGGKALAGVAGPRSPRGSPPHLIGGAAGPGLGVPAHVPDFMDGGVHPDICWSHLARDGQHVPRSGDMSSHYGGGVLILRPPGTQLDDQQAEHRCRSRSPRPASTAQPGERRQRERTEHRNREQPPGALPPPRGQPQARPVSHPSMIRREPRPRRCFYHLVRLGIRRGLAPVGGPH